MFQHSLVYAEDTLDQRPLVHEHSLCQIRPKSSEQVIDSPDIPLFKKFRDNWSNIDSTNIQIYLDFVKQHYNDCEIDQLVMFYNCDCKKRLWEMTC